MIAARKPDGRAQQQHRKDADIDLGALEPDLERQSVDPAMLPGLAQVGARPRLRRQQCAHAFDQHQSANNAQKQDIGQRDDGIEIAQHAQLPEHEHTDNRSCNAANKQHHAKLDINAAAPEMHQRPGYRRRHNLVGSRGNRHGWRHPGKNQQRGDQKSAADPEHACKKTHRAPHAQQQHDVHGNLGDGQINLHVASGAFRYRPDVMARNGVADRPCGAGAKTRHATLGKRPQCKR
jgi:hypothetical protein